MLGHEPGVTGDVSELLWNSWAEAGYLQKAGSTFVASNCEGTRETHVIVKDSETLLYERYCTVS